MTTRDPYQGQRLGNLRERVMLQQATTTTDGYGGTVYEWHDVAEVWARVEPVKSAEEFIAGGIQTVTDVLVHIRFHPDVTTAWRLIWQGQTYGITGVRNLDERRAFLALDCTHW
tara:strand:- start:115 stop:456 length:342 start_codon:yes stop_codon:yes gene_type:complete